MGLICFNVLAGLGVLLWMRFGGVKKCKFGLKEIFFRCKDEKFLKIAFTALIFERKMSI